MVLGWPFTPQVPIAFGGELRCGWDGDEVTGDVPLPIYDGGYSDHFFMVPTNQSSIQVAVKVLQVGNPTAPVALDLYLGSTHLASASIPAVSIPATGSPVWTPFVTLTAQLNAGTYYHISVSSVGSTPTDYFRTFINLAANNWWDPGAGAQYVPPTPLPPGVFGNKGSSVLWIKDPSGNDIEIVPFGDIQQPPSSMDFIADGNYPINCIVPWLSDMEFAFKAYSAGWSLTDVTTGQLLGTAPATQYYNSHGIQGIIPFQLPNPVSLVAGHRYRITLNDTQGIYSNLLRGSTVDPLVAAPGGQSPYWLGEIAYADFSAYRVLDYGGTTITVQNGHGGIGGNDQVGARFVPNFTETITRVRLKMSNVPGAPPGPGNYPAGTPVTVSLHASNENAGPPSPGSQPTGAPLASVTVDSGTMPMVGFFDVNVSFPVNANTPYWLVWSAPTAQLSQYSCERCVSPWRNLALSTQDGGSTWFYFGQGPTDLAFAAIATQELLGSPYDNGTGALLGPSALVAQPFILSKAATVSAIFLYNVGANGGTVQVKLYPDNGSGAPNLGAAIGSGTFNLSKQYFYSGCIVPLSTPAPVNANTKYWIVVGCVNNGSIALASYWTRPVDPSVPAGYECLVSSSGGTAWAPASSEVTTLIFMVGIQPAGGGPPTQVPTTLTLTAKAV